MARKPRVYLADVDGVHEWAVAAPNQQAALEALGVGQNLFAQGRAGPTTDPAAVDAAVAADGAPVRRLKGSDAPFHPVDEDDASGWAAALAAAPALTPAVRKAKAAPAVKDPAPAAAPAAMTPRPRSERAPARPARRKAPDRRPLMKAEAELTAFGREEARALGEIVREREALDRKEAKVRADLARRREALERAVARARKAYEQR